ncbi:hypothetical protein TNCV_4159951 [Trichonephila clavipes]|nr:hypothetical protein TNCV_4159951 [Trichonephila clavipes]
MNETTQQEKTIQLSSRNEQLNSAAGTKTTQLVSRNETTQLCTAVNRLQPPATAYNRLQPPTTAYDRLQPPATACNRLHRLYSRIGFFYLLSCGYCIFKYSDRLQYRLTNIIRSKTMFAIRILRLPIIDTP